MTTAPALSVVMSVYNSLRHLDASIDSVLNQSMTDFEFIIVDDGSTDGSSERLSEYAASDKRIRIIRNDANIGLTRSLNVAIQAAQSDLIARQDADDVSEPERFERQVEALRENPKLLALGTYYATIDDTGRETGRIKVPTDQHEIAWQLLFHNAFCHTSMMFRRKGPDGTHITYDEGYKYSQDFELWSRLIRIGPISNLPHTLVRYRINSQSVSARLRPEQQKLANRISAANIRQLAPDLKISDSDLTHLRGVFQTGIRSLYGRNDLVATYYLLRLWRRFLQKSPECAHSRSVWRVFWRRLGYRPLGYASRGLAMWALSRQTKAAR